MYVLFEHANIYYSYGVLLVNSMLLFHLELKKCKDYSITLNWVLIKTTIL